MATEPIAFDASTFVPTSLSPLKDVGFKKMSKAENTSTVVPIVERNWLDGFHKHGVHSEKSSREKSLAPRRKKSRTTGTVVERVICDEELQYNPTVDPMSEGGEAARVFAKQMEYTNKISATRQDKQTTRRYVGGSAAAAYEVLRNDSFGFEALKAELSQIRSNQGSKRRKRCIPSI
eukprot:scaffold3333_cov43-Attheya_sp.AAC.1